MLKTTKTVQDEKAVVVLEGRLDTVTSSELENELKTLPDDVRELTLDFEKLDYISSSGLRVLLTAQKKMIGRGEMQIVHVNDVIRDIFEITGFSDILTIL